MQFCVDRQLVDHITLEKIWNRCCEILLKDLKPEPASRENVRCRGRTNAVGKQDDEKD